MHMLRRIQQRGLRNLLAQDMPFEEIRQPDFRLVAEIRAGRHAEHLIEFFERELFGFPHEAEDHAPGY